MKDVEGLGTDWEALGGGKCWVAEQASEQGMRSGKMRTWLVTATTEAITDRGTWLSHLGAAYGRGVLTPPSRPGLTESREMPSPPISVSGTASRVAWPCLPSAEEEPPA